MSEELPRGYLASGDPEFIATLLFDPLMLVCLASQNRNPKVLDCSLGERELGFDHRETGLLYQTDGVRL